jgi:hypothetical protein
MPPMFDRVCPLLDLETARFRLLSDSKTVGPQNGEQVCFLGIGIQRQISLELRRSSVEDCLRR